MMTGIWNEQIMRYGRICLPLVPHWIIDCGGPTAGMQPGRQGAIGDNCAAAISRHLLANQVRLTCQEFHTFVVLVNLW